MTEQTFKKGDKVRTRSGLNAEVLKDDIKNSHGETLLVFLTNPDDGSAYSAEVYYANGRHHAELVNCPLDLIVEPLFEVGKTYTTRGGYNAEVIYVGEPFNNGETIIAMVHKRTRRDMVNCFSDGRLLQGPNHHYDLLPDG